MCKCNTKIISTRDFINALNSGETKCHVQNYLNGRLLPDNRLMLEELSIAMTVAKDNVQKAVNTINTFLSMPKGDRVKRTKQNIDALGVKCPTVFIIDLLIFMDFNLHP